MACLRLTLKGRSGRPLIHSLPTPADPISRSSIRPLEGRNWARKGGRGCKRFDTLHVKPGDTLKITLRNKLPPMPANAARETMALDSDACKSPTMDATSANIHFHGTNTSPTCHSDETIRTLVNGGDIFAYRVDIPRDEPPGLYWYHPHVHGISEGALLGGASGAIIVDGIETLQPAVSKLPSRVLMIRDQLVAGAPSPGGRVPSWDISLNYVPIAYPASAPAIIALPAGEKEFWRVVNASADTITDLQLTYDGVVQPLQVVAFDGVATGSQDGTRRGKTVTMTDVFLPPAGRAEFIITAPPAGTHRAVFQTLKIKTGEDGDNDPTRTLARLVTDGTQSTGAMAASMAADPLMQMPAATGAASPQRFEGIDTAKVSTRRLLYFPKCCPTRTIRTVRPISTSPSMARRRSCSIPPTSPPS